MRIAKTGLLAPFFVFFKEKLKKVAKIFGGEK